MFSSVINSIKLQTGRLKESLTIGNNSNGNRHNNGNGVPWKETTTAFNSSSSHHQETLRESLSLSRLKDNVVQTSALLRQTIIQSILPREDNNVMTTRNRRNVNGNGNNVGVTTTATSRRRRSTNKEVPKRREELTSLCKTKNDNDCDKRTSRKTIRARGERLSSHSTQEALLNRNKNDIGDGRSELVITSEEVSSSFDSDFSEDEDNTNVGDRFTRAVTGIGYRASKVIL
jgi:hypothetical protein